MTESHLANVFEIQTGPTNLCNECILLINNSLLRLWDGDDDAVPSLSPSPSWTMEEGKSNDWEIVNLTTLRVMQRMSQNGLKGKAQRNSS